MKSCKSSKYAKIEEAVMSGNDSSDNEDSDVEKDSHDDSANVGNSEDEQTGNDSDDLDEDEEMESATEAKDVITDYQDDEDDMDESIADDCGEEDDTEQVRMPKVNPLSLIRNKERRLKMYREMKKEKNKNKMKERKERRKAGPAQNPGHTIESLRQPDQTSITHLTQADNDELVRELELDEFSSYFAREYEPKVLITFSDNPTTKTRKFGLELSRIFPNALVKVRNRSSVKRICKSAIREGYSDVLIINEDRRKPDGLLLIHLPGGPTAHFKVSNVRLTTDIKRDHKEITKHRPELILTNFTTRLGVMLGRMLGALFHQDPQFKGRRAATFHNQRDFIFFRHHRYEFSKDAKRVKLRELGPRFTLKVHSIQEGLFDSKCGDYLWIATNRRHDLEASRRRFHL